MIKMKGREILKKCLYPVFPTGQIQDLEGAFLVQPVYDSPWFPKHMKIVDMQVSF
jgi:hypothetical protein